MYSYRNDAVLDLPMRMGQHDPSLSYYNPTNLFTDGDMETAGVAAWTAGGGATLTKQTTDPHGGTQCLRVAGSGGYARQVILTGGRTYLVTGWARSDGTAVPGVSIQTTPPFPHWTGTNSTSWQYFSFVVTAVGTAVDLNMDASAGYVEFDNVSCLLAEPVTRDVSGNGNHAVFGDGVTAGTFPTKRSYGRGYTFNSDYLTIADDATLDFTGAHTLSFLIRPTDLTSNRALAFKSTTAYYIWLATGGNLEWVTIGLSDTTLATPTSALHLNEFQLLSFVYNQATKVIYLNDEVLASEVSTGAISTNNNDITIGQFGGGSSYLGDIAFMGFFSTALSQIQIADLHRTMMKKINDV
jgi:hypothetical protein